MRRRRKARGRRCRRLRLRRPRRQLRKDNASREVRRAATSEVRRRASICKSASSAWPQPLPNQLRSKRLRVCRPKDRSQQHRQRDDGCWGEDEDSGCPLPFHARNLESGTFNLAIHCSACWPIFAEQLAGAQRGSRVSWRERGQFLFWRRNAAAARTINAPGDVRRPAATAA
jgi:hypothetical protein